jgi:GNAT superfamily N-acetyltransferase
MKKFLDNIIWFVFIGAYVEYVVGTKGVRCYAIGFALMVGFANPARPDFAALAACCKADEQLYCSDWDCEVPTGWRIHAENSLRRMVWEGAIPATDAFPDAIQLGPQHANQVFELAQLTKPGPFGLRSIELGEYFGWFEDGRLAAMAGERLHAGTLREISGICTHPNFRGRGLASRLTSKLIRRVMQRGETPILHVISDNPTAFRLYQQMGFSLYRETPARVISRC